MHGNNLGAETESFIYSKSCLRTKLFYNNNETTWGEFNSPYIGSSKKWSETVENSDLSVHKVDHIV